MKAPMLLALTLSISAAEAASVEEEWLKNTLKPGPPTIVTLVCEGTVTDPKTSSPNKPRSLLDDNPFPWEKPGPISMGIGINLGAGTVTGFKDFPELPVKIGIVDDTNISFRGNSEGVQIAGYIDRVTGALEVRTSGGGVNKTYALKCKPTERMF
jgi:hypothetical protein